MESGIVLFLNTISHTYGMGMGNGSGIIIFFPLEAKAAANKAVLMRLRYPASAGCLATSIVINRIELINKTNTTDLLFILISSYRVTVKKHLTFW